MGRRECWTVIELSTMVAASIDDITSVYSWFGAYWDTIHVRRKTFTCQTMIAMFNVL